MSGEAQRLRRALLAYAHHHPRASDTADGIRDFWLGGEIGVSPLILDLVLEQLVAEGILTATLLPDGITLYAVVGNRGASS